MKKKHIGKRKKGLKRWQRITDIESVEKKTDIWAIGVLKMCSRETIRVS